jgi:hypothetical protein
MNWCWPTTLFSAQSAHRETDPLAVPGRRAPAGHALATGAGPPDPSADQGKVKLECAGYPLDAAADAISDLRAGTIRGRAILTPAG